MVTGNQGQDLVGGRYVLERKLGKGGLGEVFLALDTQLNRWVAIKRLHTDSEEGADRAVAAVNEARHLASLQHPNIVTVFDFVEHGGDVMVVMEFLNGQTLEELSAPLPLADFLIVARQSLAGLAAAHRLGMIHRDIKPGNIMLAGLPSGGFQVKVLDFGLAKIIARPSRQTMDHTGSLLGSIDTMTPEQLEQEPVDHRADIYSLGCVLYHALTLRNPFEGETIAAIITSHLQHSFTPLHQLRPDLPADVCRWVENLFSREVEDRPADAAIAAERLQSPGGPAKRPLVKRALTVPQPLPAKKNKLLWPVMLAAGCTVSALAFYLVFGTPRSTPPKTSPPPIAPAVPAKVAPALESPDVLLPGDRGKLLASLGKPVLIEGKISRAGENKTGTIRFLNFEGGSRGDFALVFFVGKDGGEFSKERLQELIGKRIRATGTVSDYQGNPQMEIRDWSQISLL
ncbi:MAG: protein kinase domain-containing protein [Terrimicrobiaceae bacterium]